MKTETGEQGESGSGIFLSDLAPASSENPSSSQHFFHQLLAFLKRTVNIPTFPFIHSFFACLISLEMTTLYQ